jgi:hypothetical protein
VKENINQVSAMKLSPYFRVFEEEANTWEDKLNRILTIFDVWIDVQRRWVYLEGIFTGIFTKVEKILKGNLDSIPSPSPTVKIQIMGGKVCLRCKGKTLLGVGKKLLTTKSLITSPAMFCLITSTKLSCQ